MRHRLVQPSALLPTPFKSNRLNPGDREDLLSGRKWGSESRLLFQSPSFGPTATLKKELCAIIHHTENN